MRTREIREIRTLLLNGESVRLVAPPEAGRTYFLEQIAREMESRGFTSFRVSGRRPFRGQPYVALREAGLVSLRSAQSESDIADELLQGLQPLGHPLLLIDDAEHLDLNSAYLIEQVRLRLGLPVVVVTPPFVMLDEHGRAATNKIRTHARLELGPLGYAQISLLAQRVLGAPAQPEVLSEVLSMSSGMTGVAAEILRSAAREQRIVQHESGWALHAPSLWNVHLRTTVEQLMSELGRNEFRALHALALAESAATERFQAVAGPELIELSRSGRLTTFADPADGTHIAPRPSLIIDYFQEQPVDPLHFEALNLLRALDDPPALDRALACSRAQVTRAQTFDRSENLGTGSSRFHRADTSHRLASAAREWRRERTVAHAVEYLDLLLATDGYVQQGAEVIAQAAEGGSDSFSIRLLLHELFWITQSDLDRGGERLRAAVAAETDPGRSAIAEAFGAYLRFCYSGLNSEVDGWWAASAGRHDEFSVAMRHFIGVVSGRVTEPVNPESFPPHYGILGHVVEIANVLLQSRTVSPEIYERDLRAEFAEARATSDYRRITVGAYFLAQQEAATFRDLLATETVSVTLANGTPNLAYADFFSAQLRWAAYLHYTHGEPDLARSVLAETARYPAIYGPLPAMHPAFGTAIEHLVSGETDTAVDLLLRTSAECHTALLSDAAWTYAVIAFLERPTPEVFTRMELVADKSTHGTPALMRLVGAALEADPALPRLAQHLNHDTEIATAISLLAAIRRGSREDENHSATPYSGVLADTIRELRSVLAAGVTVQPQQDADDRIDISLTRREREVAMLAVTLQNREIAERLSISVRTVENHLARAMKKLGVTARADLAHAVGLSG